MGDTRVKLAQSNEEIQNFMKNVLKDMRALERMLEEEWFETDPIRIGAEQELCLIDRNAKPFLATNDILNKMDDPNFTHEFAKFNMEINLNPPLEFKGDCLSQMEHNLQRDVALVREVAQEFGAEVLLTGILPTIRKSDVSLKSLTEIPRYKALCDAIDNLRGKEYELRIQGMDELLMKFDTPMLEGCNTGFQVHLQVKPNEFVSKYNAALAISAPVLASAVNSAVFLGKRLWAETRIALFHQSVDTRGVGDHLRDSSPRVTFGNSWVKDSILDIYKDDISRYRVLLSSNLEEDVEAMMNKGIPPELMALKVHNGTVYRWNRACYGVGGGKPHLRIENRVLPSGPTVIDEMANTAFWLGLLNGFEDEHPDITKELDFDNARLNFFAASKMGLDTNFEWTKGRKISAKELILKELLPLAKHGLEKADISTSDIDTYLSVIHDRVESLKTGAYWMVKSYANIIKEANREQALTTITSSMLKNQKKGEPVHKWGLAKFEDVTAWTPSKLLVEECMTTDLFTARKDDLLEFVSNLMDWRSIRYIPIEDDRKHLVGLVSMRMVMREYSKVVNDDKADSIELSEFMIKNPITIHPEASIMEAMNIMLEHKIGCLPVVKNSRLVGIITEHNFMDITRRLLYALAGEKEHN
jgi:CBS domain-containing protein/gamma-glutamylcysteine synthetase